MYQLERLADSLQATYQLPAASVASTTSTCINVSEKTNHRAASVIPTEQASMMNDVYEDMKSKSYEHWKMQANSTGSSLSERWTTFQVTQRGPSG